MVHKSISPNIYFFILFIRAYDFMIYFGTIVCEKDFNLSLQYYIIIMKTSYLLPKKQK